MGGICGVIHFDGKPVEEPELGRMTGVVAHRGPDGIRHHVDGAIGLGHLALTLTTEDALEEQPLASADRRLVLVADARLDNRDDLVAALGAGDSGRRALQTDADLILAAYRRWGVECAARFLGDFAFAIWDASERRLFAARDAMGMRAFHYRLEPRRLLFATEVQQLLVAEAVPCRLFEPAVAAHLAGPFGRPDWSFYDGILQLPAAHALIATAQGARVFRYWDASSCHPARHRREEEYWEAFRGTFIEAVRCRMRGAKPVGLSLSGGTDSGSIAAVAGWLRQGPGAYSELRAYSHAFETLRDCDERYISDPIARQYGLPVTDIPADQAWPLKDYPDHGPDRDDPFLSPYQTLMDLILDTARAEGVGVMMVGERGDEVVGSWVYDTLGLFAARQWGPLIRDLRAAAEIDRVPLYQVVERQIVRPLLARFLPRRHLPARRNRPRSELQPKRGMLAPWILPEFAARTGLADIVAEGQRSQTRGFPFDRRRNLIFSTLSMRRALWIERRHASFGLGFADPWSDRRVAETVLATPAWAVNRLSDDKRLARQALGELMPAGSRHRTRKIIPERLFDLGLRERSRDIVLDLARDSRAAALGFLDSKAFIESYEAFCDRRPTSHDIWWAISLEMWLRRFWDGHTP